MNSRAGLSPALPVGVHGQNAGKRIEFPFLGEKCSVRRRPPVAGQEARHHAVPAATVPDQRPIRLEHARELADDPRVVSRVRKEPKRCEQIENGVEAASPLCWLAAHVTTTVAKRAARSAFPGDRKKIPRVIDSVDIESGFGKKVRVATLSTRYIEDSRPRRKAQDLYHARDFGAISLRSKKRSVLEEIVGVERRLPPLFRLSQKKTGSR